MQNLDIRMMLNALLAHVKAIIAGVVIGLILFGSYAYFFVPKQYVSTAKLYIRNTAGEAQSNSSTTGNLVAAEYLVNSYVKGIKLTPIMEAAAARMENAVTAQQLKGMVSASGVSESSFLNVTVKHTDPAVAQAACEAVAQTLALDFPSLTGDPSSAKVADPASRASQVEPNVAKSAMIGAAVGGALMIAAFLLSELLNNTIRDKESLQAQIDVPVLGEIPSYSQTEKEGRRRG